MQALYAPPDAAAAAAELHLKDSSCRNGANNGAVTDGGGIDSIAEDNACEADGHSHADLIGGGGSEGAAADQTTWQLLRNATVQAELRLGEMHQTPSAKPECSSIDYMSLHTHIICPRACAFCCAGLGLQILQQLGGINTVCCSAHHHLRLRALARHKSWLQFWGCHFPCAVETSHAMPAR